mmetsp:Transcript_21851/g.70593  ORF Transcript_21851/g.70593 Transcript_21851/m.70593 type:complete len:224 (-) Transcript_21851:51-722(-)
MDTRLVAYDDLVLRVGDALLLKQPTSWLTDPLVQLGFLRLEKETVPNRTDVALLEPAVAMFLACTSPSDAAEQLGQMGLKGKELVLLAVNDSQPQDIGVGGSHWSLLAMRRGRWEHYDSLGSANARAAKRLSRALSEFFGLAANERVIEMATPQQRNGCDCGVHALLAAEALLSAEAASDDAVASEGRVPEWLRLACSPDNVSGFRGRMLAFVEELCDREERA